jgi:hypothetical protein
MKKKVAAITVTSTFEVIVVSILLSKYLFH